MIFSSFPSLSEWLSAKDSMRVSCGTFQMTHSPPHQLLHILTSSAVWKGPRGDFEILSLHNPQYWLSTTDRNFDSGFAMLDFFSEGIKSYWAPCSILGG